ncbi:MAG: BtpA/SgcQ family protein [Bryobacterales bacterium]|nr:BtpA/SgcQ family protein [Bryobacterales bacterium]
MNLAAFCARKPIIGMLHVPALPGSPANTLDFAQVREWVLRDASALADGGVDALMIENYGDVPFYPAQVPPHTVAFLTALAMSVRDRHALPLGINVLRNDGVSAMAVAAAVGAEYVRVNVLTGARLADQGILQGAAHEIARYRRLLNAEVRIFADAAVKHSAALAERTLEDEIEDTVHRGLADALIVTGTATGKATPTELLERAKQASGSAPVFAGSGVTEQNAAEVLAIADGAIVGTAFKEGGVSQAPVDPGRVARFMKAVRQ